MDLKLSSNSPGMNNNIKDSADSKKQANLMEKAIELAGDGELSIADIEQLGTISKSDGKVSTNEVILIESLKTDGANFTAEVLKAKKNSSFNPSDFSFPVKPEIVSAVNPKYNFLARLHPEIPKEIMNDPVKLEMFISLLGGNESPENVKEVIDTMAYIDKQNISYKDINDVIAGQKKAGRDSGDILAAVQGYAVVAEGLKMGLPNYEALITVMIKLKDGSLRVNDETKNKAKVMNDSKKSTYWPDENTVYQQNFDINDFGRRGLLLHELTHAGQDIQYEGKEAPTHGDAELAAYLNQSVYMISNGRNSADLKIRKGDSPETIAFRKSFYEMGEAYTNLQKVEANPNATFAEKESAKKNFNNKQQTFKELIHENPNYSENFFENILADGVH